MVIESVEVDMAEHESDKNPCLKEMEKECSEEKTNPIRKQSIK